MKKILFIVIIIWVGLIFHNSGESGAISNARSRVIASQLKNIYLNITERYIKVDSVRDKQTISITENTKLKAAQSAALDKKLNVIVRKIGHFIEYLILVIIISWFIDNGRRWDINIIINILFICLIIAVLDEFYQSFVGRTSMVSDVVIDFSGSMFGLFIYIIFERFGKVIARHND